MANNQYWYCDVCGKKIESVEDGWLEWVYFKGEEGNGQGRGLRIVHKDKQCMYNSQLEYKRDKGITKDDNLKSFLGSDGLMLLLEFLADGEIPKEELLEVIKRIHIPGYEIAHCHFTDAINEGVFEPNRKEGYYWLSDINAVIAWLEKGNN
jgi:hypothetical protein